MSQAAHPGITQWQQQLLTPSSLDHQQLLSPSLLGHQQLLQFSELNTQQLLVTVHYPFTVVAGVQFTNLTGTTADKAARKGVCVDEDRERTIRPGVL